MSPLAKKTTAAVAAVLLVIAAACGAKAATEGSGQTPLPRQTPVQEEQAQTDEATREEPAEEAVSPQTAVDHESASWTKSETAAAAVQTLAGCAWESADGKSTVEVYTGKIYEKAQGETVAWKSTVKGTWTSTDGRSLVKLTAAPMEGGEEKDFWIVIDASDIKGRSYMVESDQFSFAKKYYDTFGG